MGWANARPTSCNFGEKMSFIDQLIDEMPVDLRIAVAATLEDPSLNCGSQDVRAVMSAKYKKGPTINSSRVAEMRSNISEWVNRQKALQAQADEIIEELWLKFKPEANSVPIWFTQSWAFHLRNPWSAVLDKSISDAREWIDSNA